MRLASYNVENLFSLTKAMNLSNWAGVDGGYPGIYGSLRCLEQDRLLSAAARAVRECSMQAESCAGHVAGPAAKHWDAYDELGKPQNVTAGARSQMRTAATTPAIEDCLRY